MKKTKPKEASVLKYVDIINAPQLRLPVDPILPPGFWSTPNEDRSESELQAWWNEPFAWTNDGRLDVYCLDGGAWDRPTGYGSADSLEAARELAMSKLQGWHATQATFGYALVKGGKIFLVRMPRYPGDDELRLGPFANHEEASAESERLRDLGNRPRPSDRKKG